MGLKHVRIGDRLYHEFPGRRFDADHMICDCAVPVCTCVMADWVASDEPYPACESFVGSDGSDHRWMCKNCSHESGCHLTLFEKRHVKIR